MRSELDELLIREAAGDEEWLASTNILIQGWLGRGDGVAIYENADLGHPEVGRLKLVSFGSRAAQLETDDPPQRLPDIGTDINWRYVLKGTYR
jgi:hypothetical protein